MPLHDRLKNPTLEASPPKGRGLPVMLVLAVLAAAFAYAMPGLQSVSAETEDPSLLVVESPTGSTHTQTASPAPEGDDEGGEKADNHGKVVSLAAHCDVKGKAHGELVRSIAKDKAATVADAEAACAAAMAAQEAAGANTSNGRSAEAKAAKAAKAGGAAKPTGSSRPKPPKPGDTETETDSMTNTDSGSDGDDSETDDSETDDDEETDDGHGRQDKAKGKP